MPGYFRFVTLLAFHAFLELKVDASILEVGVGGMYDSTNVVPKPIVTGISALGIDHVAVLGKTLEDIAWQKGGIYKEGVPALTVKQPESALNVLRSRAKELKASSFTVIDTLPEIKATKLGLAGHHQVENANLAVHLVRGYMQQKELENGKEYGFLSEGEVKGLASTRWPGRCQQVDDPRRLNTEWFLDGAHTVESLRCCFNWFVSPGVALPEEDSSLSQRPRRVLMFNCTSGRSGDNFLGVVQEAIRTRLAELNSGSKLENFFDRVIFCTNVTYADGHFKGDLTTKAVPEDDLEHLKTQQQLRAAWLSRLPGYPSDQVLVLPSVEHAIKAVEDLGTNNHPVQVIVSGSLHLVGGVIEVANIGDVAL